MYNCNTQTKLHTHLHITLYLLLVISHGSRDALQLCTVTFCMAHSRLRRNKWKTFGSLMHGLTYTVYLLDRGHSTVQFRSDPLN